MRMTKTQLTVCFAIVIATIILLLNAVAAQTPYKTIYPSTLPSIQDKYSKITTLYYFSKNSPQNYNIINSKDKINMYLDALVENFYLSADNKWLSYFGNDEMIIKESQDTLILYYKTKSHETSTNHQQRAESKTN